MFRLVLFLIIFFFSFLIAKSITDYQKSEGKYSKTTRLTFLIGSLITVSVALFAILHEYFHLILK